MFQFNLDNYTKIVSSLKSSGYEFIRFKDIDKLNDKAILLRHDIDADITAALKMAQAESNIGIQATYFFMLRSPIYNLMGRENFTTVNKIIDLKHDIGLHYDQGFDSIRGWDYKKTQEAIDKETAWLEDQFSIKISAISFHQPGPEVLNNKIDTGSRINTYDTIRLHEYQYFSDSNRNFPFASKVSEEFSNISNLFPDKLQLLIHPMWWVYDDPNTNKVWNKALLSNIEIMQRQLLATEKVYGAKRNIYVDE